MKALLTVALLAASCMLASASIKATSSGLYWDDAFGPGAANLPQMCLDIACVDANLCFIAGGSNGVGFGIYGYNGQLNGRVEEMRAVNMSMMVLSVEAAGTAAAPKGASGGVTTIFFPAQFQAEHYYDAATRTWMVSQTPLEFVTATPSISASKDGSTVVAIDETTTSGVLYSTDGAQTYTYVQLNGYPTPNMGNCSAPNQVEVIDSQTWYILLGQEPQTASSSSSSSSSGFHGRKTVRKGRHDVTLDYSSGSAKISAARKIPVKMDDASSGETCVGYSYQLIKTTNAGQSYTAVFEKSNATFTLFDISCLDVNTCVAVGGNDMSSMVYMTTDGTTWKHVYTVNGNANGTVAFSEVAFVNTSDIWIGGAVINQAAQSAVGVFYYSRDGGNTWFEYNNLQYAVAEIMSLSFPNSTVGFATGITQEQSSSILKYAVQPYYGYFAQIQCLTSSCNLLCEEMYFPQGLCLQSNTGGIIATCSESGLEVKSYETTSCIGSYNTSTAPVNQCLQAQGGGGLPYFENLCNVGMTRKSDRAQTHTALAKVLVH